MVKRVIGSMRVRKWVRKLIVTWIKFWRREWTRMRYDRQTRVSFGG